MIITKTSMMTGKINTMEIEVTQKQIEQWKNGMLIQDAMPNLTDGEREFIVSGITPKEWEQAFGE